MVYAEINAASNVNEPKNEDEEEKKRMKHILNLCFKSIFQNITLNPNIVKAYSSWF